MSHEHYKRVGVLLSATAIMLSCQPDDSWLVVSLVHLISDPKQYEGSDVGVSGHARMSRGRLFLFLTSEHARADDIVSAVLLDQTLDGKKMEGVSECHGRFVTVFGQFDRQADGFNRLTDIERVIGYGPEGRIDEDCFAVNGAGT